MTTVHHLLLLLSWVNINVAPLLVVLALLLLRRWIVFRIIKLLLLVAHETLPLCSYAPSFVSKFHKIYVAGINRVAKKEHNKKRCGNFLEYMSSL